MYEMNEVIVMIFCIIGLIIILYLIKKEYIPLIPYFLASYCCIVASNVFTVVEGFWLFDVFNFLEHLSYLFSGIFMLIGTISYTKEDAPWKWR